MMAKVNIGIPTTDRLTALTQIDRRLEIKHCDDCPPALGRHNLLLGFRFGTNLLRPDHPAIINLSLQPLNREQLFEGWWYKGEITFTNSGPVKIAECQDYTVAILQKEVIAPGGFRVQTGQAYRELLDAVRSTQHTKLVKIWNYFGEINSGNNDFEKYRQFSMGRAEAFRDLGIRDEDVPTGTAIGTPNSSGLSLIALASNQNFFPVENPRQVSAFRYPRKYGPSSPKFSRGGLVSSDSHKLFLLSGTAAVVGHESKFSYNTSLQTTETCKNLGYLCDSISNHIPSETQFALDENSVLRVYLKKPDDYFSVAQIINKVMKRSNHNVAYLHGTICRQELMVEIDGVKVM
jgi:chorismate lyase/3-hydroxybenzoate synthase